MSLIDRIFGRRKRNKTPVSFKAPPAKKEDQTPPKPKKTVLITKIPRVKNPVLSFKLRPGADEFEQPEYDMAEIGRIEDVEAYVQRAFTQKEGLMFKEDWEAIGKNLQTIRYIKHRFEQFSAATGEPFIAVLRGAGEDLIRYSNAFLVKVRDRKASGGRPRKVVGKKKALEPVAGYFAMPVSTVRFKRDDNGKILKYRQLLPTGKYKDFNPEDVIHIHFRKKKGFLVGTPSLIPVKDDIRALRRIEENIEMLIYQHLFPLYHYQVGTEDAPAREYADGTREIDVVQQEVELMPAEGMIVTPERHQVKAIGAEGRALRAEGYLNHFKQRIFAGLGVSAIDMGEGDTANRSTADNMSRNMVDDVKHYQRTWEMAVNEYIVKELLLESTFPNPIDDENIVRLKFNEIDVESKIKVENHAIDAFSGHAITQTELRRIFGKEPFTEEEKEDTFWKLIEEPRIMMQSIDEPYCYSSDTEVMTSQGWKTFDALDPQDKVATLRNGKELVFEVPSKYFEYDWDGEMYHLSTRFIDLLVTPNHKLYVSPHRKKNDFSLLRADTVIGEYKKFKRGAIWSGQEMSTFRLPGTHKPINQFKDIHLAPRDVNGDDWLQFLAWYISEGYMRTHGYEIAICQSKDKHPTESEEIWDLLQRMELSPRWSGDCQIVCNSKQVNEWLRLAVPGHSYDKRIPPFIKDLSVRQIRLFIDTLMKGDGETVYHYLYSTVSKGLADDLQELCLRAGWAASIRLDKSNRTVPIYRIGIHRDKYIDVADRTPYGPLAESSFEGMISYTGKVYCVETTSGLLFVRRNGKTCWCGNSALAQAVARAATTAPQQGDFDKENTERKRELEADRRAKAAGTGGKKPGPKTTKKSSGQRSARAKTRPSNQHGTKSSPEKRKSSFVWGDMVAPGNKVTKLYADLQENTMQAIERGTFGTDWFKQLALATGTMIQERLQRLTRIDFRSGFRSTRASLDPDDLPMPFSVLESRIQRIVNRFVAVLVRRVGDNYDPNDTPDIRKIKVTSVFDALKFRSRFIYNSERNKARNYGVLRGFRKLGYPQAEIVDHADSCELCKSLAGRVDIENATIEDVPGYHPNCTCTVVLPEGQENQ